MDPEWFEKVMIMAYSRRYQGRDQKEILTEVEEEIVSQGIELEGFGKDMNEVAYDLLATLAKRDEEILRLKLQLGEAHAALETCGCEFDVDAATKAEEELGKVKALLVVNMTKLDKTTKTLKRTRNELKKSKERVRNLEFFGEETLRTIYQTQCRFNNEKKALKNVVNKHKQLVAAMHEKAERMTTTFKRQRACIDFSRFALYRLYQQLQLAKTNVETPVTCAVATQTSAVPEIKQQDVQTIEKHQKSETVVQNSDIDSAPTPSPANKSMRVKVRNVRPRTPGKWCAFQVSNGFGDIADGKFVPKCNKSCKVSSLDEPEDKENLYWYGNTEDNKEKFVCQGSGLNEILDMNEVDQHQESREPQGCRPPPLVGDWSDDEVSEVSSTSDASSLVPLPLSPSSSISQLIVEDEGWKESSAFVSFLNDVENHLAARTNLSQESKDKVDNTAKSGNAPESDDRKVLGPRGPAREISSSITIRSAKSANGRQHPPKHAKMEKPKEIKKQSPKPRRRQEQNIWSRLSSTHTVSSRSKQTLKSPKSITKRHM